MFHGIKCLIVSLVFSRLGFWSGSLFLIAPFPDLCLLVPFSAYLEKLVQLRWTGHVIRMPNERLPKKVFNGELQEGKHFQSYKATKTPSTTF